MVESKLVLEKMLVCRVCAVDYGSFVNAVVSHCDNCVRELKENEEIFCDDSNFHYCKECSKIATKWAIRKKATWKEYWVEYAARKQRNKTVSHK